MPGDGVVEERKKILVVEDDDALRKLLVEELEEARYQVCSARSAEQAASMAPVEFPDLVISDLRLPGMSGTDLLVHLRREKQAPPFLIITAFGTVSQAVEALKLGADNFLTKPLDLDHLILTVARALEVAELRQQVAAFKAAGGDASFHGMTGRSAVMSRLFQQIRQVAEATGPVVITGESGTGKELVARAIHAESSRRRGPFLPVNCASIPEHLLESELFGHEAGSFTGANRQRQGLFQAADNGVLFLDEVTQLPLTMQAKLLRVLQENRIKPVGADREVSIDVRVLAAANVDLEEEVRENRFREDLFYRLEVFSLQVPPLRSRGGDIDLLAAHYLALYAGQLGKRVEGITAEALTCLRKYPFPGNIRELQNLIQRAVTFSSSSMIRVEDLPERVARLSMAPGGSIFPLFPEDEILSMEEIKRRYVLHVLELTGGNKRRAAQLLGLARRTLYRYLGDSEEAAGD